MTKPIFAAGPSISARLKKLRKPILITGESRDQMPDSRIVYYLNEKKYGPSVVNSPMKRVFEVVRTRIR